MSQTLDEMLGAWKKAHDKQIYEGTDELPPRFYELRKRRTPRPRHSTRRVSRTSTFMRGCQQANPVLMKDAVSLNSHSETTQTSGTEPLAPHLWGDSLAERLRQPAQRCGRGATPILSVLPELLYKVLPESLYITLPLCY